MASETPVRPPKSYQEVPGQWYDIEDVLDWADKWKAWSLELERLAKALCDDLQSALDDRDGLLQMILRAARAEGNTRGMWHRIERNCKALREMMEAQNAD